MLILRRPRTGLDEPRVIVALMAQDLNDLRREEREPNFEALADCGWSRRQLIDYAMAARELAAQTFSTTRAPDDERIKIVMARDDAADAPHFDYGAFDAKSPQAKPFLSFDRAMRNRLADFEEHQGCNRSQPLLEGEA